jgi:peptide/nickel transport system permease protein
MLPVGPGMDEFHVLILRRVAIAVATLLLISVLISLGVEMLPGDLATAVLGQMATPEALAAFRLELGLDQPVHLRYLDWLGGILNGDMGTSLANNRPVADLIGLRLWNTLFLATAAALVAVPLSVGLGFLMALYRETFLDKALSMVTLTTISFPEYLIAYLLIAILSVQIPIFPSMAAVSPDMAFGDRLYVIALPVLTLVLAVAAHMMRLTRAAIINVLTSPYVEMARFKGMRNSWILFFHALPNALAPIINVVAVNLAYLVVGVVVVEVVFVYPGLGQLLADSVLKRDLPVVQACALIFAGTFIFLNLIADVMSIYANPRLRYPK